MPILLAQKEVGTLLQGACSTCWDTLAHISRWSISSTWIAIKHAGELTNMKIRPVETLLYLNIKIHGFDN